MGAPLEPSLFSKPPSLIPGYLFLPPSFLFRESNPVLFAYDLLFSLKYGFRIGPLLCSISFQPSHFPFLFCRGPSILCTRKNTSTTMFSLSHFYDPFTPQLRAPPTPLSVVNFFESNKTNRWVFFWTASGVTGETTQKHSQAPVVIALSPSGNRTISDLPFSHTVYCMFLFPVLSIFTTLQFAHASALVLL